MARPPDTTLDAAVLAAVAKHSDGASIEQIVGATKAPRRSAQRRLAALVEQGQLRATGARNQRRYHLVAARAVFEPSPAAARLRDSLAKPLAERTPVGYDAAFLESYRPNVDAYLPSVIRDRLRVLGRPPGPERPMGTYARQILDRLLIDLSWASSHLEGNTYTRLDTENLIEFGRQAPGKDQREAQMILNHKAAIEMLVSSALFRSLIAEKP